MNYRQWKKNYKKKHGYNPSLMEDKRKQAKELKETLQQMNQADIANLSKVIINGFANACKIIGEAFNNIGDLLKIE